MATIMIVDDDRAIQATIRPLLERDGYDVVVADNGWQALQQWRSTATDLLIVDIFMPGMDGFETIRLINQERPGTPIIVISGSGTAETALSRPDFLTMATKLGAVRSLQKPFRPAALSSLVAECLAEAGRWKQRRLDPGGTAQGRG